MVDSMVAFSKLAVTCIEFHVVADVDARATGNGWSGTDRMEESVRLDSRAS